jgi:hypothetical protein
MYRYLETILFSRALSDLYWILHVSVPNFRRITGHLADVFCDFPQSFLTNDRLEAGNIPAWDPTKICHWLHSWFSSRLFKGSQELTLCNPTEERRPHLHRDWSLKSCKIRCAFPYLPARGWSFAACNWLMRNVLVLIYRVCLNTFTVCDMCTVRLCSVSDSTVPQFTLKLKISFARS